MIDISVQDINGNPSSHFWTFTVVDDSLLTLENIHIQNDTSYQAETAGL